MEKLAVSLGFLFPKRYICLVCKEWRAFCLSRACGEVLCSVIGLRREL